MHEETKLRMSGEKMENRSTAHRSVDLKGSESVEFEAKIKIYLHTCISYSVATTFFFIDFHLL